MFVVLAFTLLLTHSVSYTQDDFTRSWKQKGLWTSNANQTNVLREFLKVSQGTVEFEYINSINLAFLILKGKDESSETVRVFLKMKLNKTSQTVKLQDLQVELSLYKKDYRKDIRINSSIIFFNITYKMRQTLLFDSERNNFKVQFLDVEKQYPTLIFEFVNVVILIGILWVALLVKIIVQCEQRDYSTYLGLFSIQIIQLWLIKCSYGIFHEVYYLRDSQMANFVIAFSGMSIFCLSVHFCWCFHTLRKEQKYRKTLKIKPNLFATILYLVLFLCLVSGLLPLRLWCILLIPIMNEVFQVKEGKYLTNKHITNQALFLFFLYLYLIVVFPAYSQEIKYPKEEASAWWIYGIFYFLQIGLFYLKMKGGFAFLRRAKLLIALRLKKDDYSKLKDYCPICFKSVAFSQVGLAEAGESTNQEWIKGQCEHYFHKKCVKDNIDELGQCSIDHIKWSQELKQLGE